MQKNSEEFLAFHEQRIRYLDNFMCSYRLMSFCFNGLVWLYEARHSIPVYLGKSLLGHCRSQVVSISQKYTLWLGWGWVGQLSLPSMDGASPVSVVVLVHLIHYTITLYIVGVVLFW